MADRTDIKLTTESTDGKTINTSITYVNPDATNLQLKTMAQKFNALTTNTYEATYRIDTTHCDSDNRQTPTLTVGTYNQNDLDKAKTGNFATIPVNYSGDGFVYARRVTGCVNIGFGYGVFSNQPAITARNTAQGIYEGDEAKATGGTFIICATETDNYRAPTPITLIIND